MSDGIRVWAVGTDDSLTELESAKLSYEERIENWISHSTSVLVPDDSGLLVIGRQVETHFGGRVDLLCINGEGDLVIVELKRDKTPREITAQALDYASWVQDLTYQQVEEIASEYFKGESLKQRFEGTFPDREYPQTINAQHSIRIVASRIDDSTERIIRYLSSKGIAINFVRFHLFKTADGKEQLVRTFVVPPAQAEADSLRSQGTRRPVRIITLQYRLEQTINEAEREFLTERLSDSKQEVNKARYALLYRASSKVRFLVRARKSHVHVIQKGRFSDDEGFWRAHLSSHKVGFRSAGKHLGFTLTTREDFKFFQDTMEQKLPSFHWSSSETVDDEEENEDEEA